MIMHCKKCARSTRHRINLDKDNVECQECEHDFVDRFRRHEGDEMRRIPSVQFIPRWENK